MKLSDEKLMAFVDEELSAEEAQQIKREVEANAEYQAKVDQFKQTKALLGNAYEQILQEPIPQKLLDMLSNSGRGETDNQIDKIINLNERRSAKSSTFAKPLQQVAIAASVALMIGGFAGYQLGSDATDLTHQLARADAGFMVAGNPLYEALESVPSNTVYRTATEGDIIKPIMSFKATDNRFCREFEINSDSSISVGVACRSGNKWQVEVLLAAGQRVVGDVNYQPASGYSEAALNAVLDNMWNGDAFDIEQERNLIDNGWR